MWKDSYLIGNEKIDNQHKELFRNAGILLNSLKDIDTPEHKQFFSNAINFLKNYVVTHFHDEETYAISVGYEDIKRHKELHDELTLDVLDYEQEFINTDFAPPVIERFLGFLSTWLVYHVADEDQRIPKGIITESGVDNADQFLHEYANKARQAITIVTGISDHDISYELNSYNRFEPAAYFRVNIVGHPRLGVEFSFSNEFALGVFKSLTGIDQQEANDLTYSALSELCNIMGGKFAEILTASGAGCSADRAVQFFFGANEKRIRRRISLSSKIGDMEVTIFVKA